MNEPKGITTGWEPDERLHGYFCRLIALPDAPVEDGEPPGSLHATIIRRGTPSAQRAVLYVHGWSDYFFQEHLADFFAQQGFDFYAIDLRRYGRSLVAGQFPGFVTDLQDYWQELDEAIQVIRSEGHDEVTLMAHSTGGLVAALWADARPDQINGLILNSPWLDLHGSALLRTVGGPLIATIGQSYPTRVIPLPDNQFYLRITHADFEGEWGYDRDLKSTRDFEIRAGWLRAILQGHDRVAEGLNIQVPVLTLLSDHSDFRRQFDLEALSTADTVLDVTKLAHASVQLGRHVTVVRIVNGLHDLVLSPPAVRQRVFDEMSHWMGAYLA